MTPVAPTLQAFFTDRLTRQLQASPRTIASYRDTLRLLLCFTQERTGKQPAKLDWDDLNEALISAFLEHLETDRHNTPRTRNLRLTAIRSLFKYAALRHPEHASVIAQVLSIPPKRHQKRRISFLTAEESKALIDAPDQSRWEGRRDRAMLTLTIQAGLGVRTDRAEHRRHRARDRRARPLRRQRPETEDRSAHHSSPSRPHRLADRARRQTNRSAVRDPHRTPAQPRRDRATREQPTPPPQRRPARRCGPSSSTRTSCVTAARCHSSRPVSTPPSSPSGFADTRMSVRPSPTSTPTSRSRRKPSRSSPQPTSSPAATNPRTRPSHSLRACDYADKQAGVTGENPSELEGRSARPRRRRRHSRDIGTNRLKFTPDLRVHDVNEQTFSASGGTDMFTVSSTSTTSAKTPSTRAPRRCAT